MDNISKNFLTKQNGFLDVRAKTLVGKLLKRIDVLSLTKNLTPELYKNLVKELVYEEFRVMKGFITLINSKIEFTNGNQK